MDLPNELKEEFLNLGFEIYQPSLKFSESFVQKTHQFFEEHKDDSDPGKAPDEFFAHVAGLWMKLRRLGRDEQSEDIWFEALRVAHDWERASERLLHKGAGYYFWGGTAILRGNFRRGFLLLHGALEEDQRKHGSGGLPNSPAYKFVTLDKVSQEQFFLPLVELATRRIEDALDSYRQNSGSKLTYLDFQKRFLKQYDLKETVFLFSLVVFEKVNFEITIELLNLYGGTFWSQLCANTLFDLCQVAEEIVRTKNREGTFKVQADFLMRKMAWDMSGDPLAQINQAQNNDFEDCIEKLLKGTLVAKRAPSCTLERDLWITYALRNCTAHELSSKKVVGKHFFALFQSVMNTVFTAVEI